MHSVSFYSPNDLFIDQELRAAYLCSAGPPVLRRPVAGAQGAAALLPAPDHLPHRVQDLCRHHFRGRAKQ